MELQAQPMDAYLDDQQQFANGMPDDTFIESSVSSVSTWTDFTNRYSWNWEPDCCLKIRKRWVPCLLEVEHTFWQFGMQRDSESTRSLHGGSLRALFNTSVTGYEHQRQHAC